MLTSYDYQVLSIVSLLTLAVIVLLVILQAMDIAQLSRWIAMPLGWFVGATMVWGYGKYKNQ